MGQELARQRLVQQRLGLPAPRARRWRLDRPRPLRAAPLLAVARNAPRQLAVAALRRRLGGP
eukprot:5331874-Pyramimonas_sp.AAC.1